MLLMRSSRGVYVLAFVVVFAAAAVSLRDGQAAYDEAERLFEDALPQWRNLADVQGLAQWQVRGRRVWTGHALFHLGLVAYAGRDWDRAAPLLTEVVRIYDANAGETEAIEKMKATRLVRRIAGSSSPRIALTGLRSRGSIARPGSSGESVSRNRAEIHMRFTRWNGSSAK